MSYCVLGYYNKNTPGLVLYKEKIFNLVYHSGGWKIQKHGVSICLPSTEAHVEPHNMTEKQKAKQVYIKTHVQKTDGD